MTTKTVKSKAVKPKPTEAWVTMVLRVGKHRSPAITIKSVLKSNGKTEYFWWFECADQVHGSYHTKSSHVKVRIGKEERKIPFKKDLNVERLVLARLLIAGNMFRLFDPTEPPSVLHSNALAVLMIELDQNIDLSDRWFVLHVERVRGDANFVLTPEQAVGAAEMQDGRKLIIAYCGSSPDSEIPDGVKNHFIVPNFIGHMVSFGNSAPQFNNALEIVASRTRFSKTSGPS